MSNLYYVSQSVRILFSGSTNRFAESCPQKIFSRDRFDRHKIVHVPWFEVRSKSLFIKPSGLRGKKIRILFHLVYSSSSPAISAKSSFND